MRHTTAKVTPFLFSWQEVEAKSDINRLGLFLRFICDEELMRKLEGDRKNGRDDYPIRCMWNAILAGIVYQHKTVESLRRELMRNADLRQACGFDPIMGCLTVPPADVFSRIYKKLSAYTQEIEEMFDALVEELGRELPEFGHRLAIDSKAIQSYGKPNKHEEADGRRDLDADWGIKEYKGKRVDGTEWKTTKKWFGYKLHLLVDAKYEIH